MKTDGSILIDTKIIDGGMEKGFELIKDEMSSVGITAKKVGEQIELSFSKMDVSKPIANAVAKVQQLEEQLAAVTSDYKLSVSEGDDKAAEKFAAKRISVYERLEAARDKLATELAVAVQKEAKAEEEATQRKIKAAQKETAAKKREQEKQYREMTKPARRFGNRLREIISGALVFNLISAGLRNVTSYFGKALKSNNEFTASVAGLKGALLTAFQPIYEYVAPAIIYLIRILTTAVQVIGQFIAALAGKSYSDMQKNAESIYDQANAIDAVGGAAKEAKKQLMGFDEINKLQPENTGGGGGTSDSIIPDFSGLGESGLEADLNNILQIVLAIGAALLTWKIASLFTGSLSLAAGLALAVGGAIMYATSWADAFANGINWKNLTKMLGSAAAVVAGLALAFGTTGAAVGLLITGIGLVILSLREWITTGELTNEACATLVIGIMAIGAAIALFTGNWIPLLVAGIASAVVLIAKNWDSIVEGAKNMLDSISNYLTDAFSNGFINGIITIVGDAIMFLWNVFVEFINGVIENWNSIWNSVSSYQTTGTIPSATGYSATGYSATPDVPYLARGAVIPPNREFLAVLGDQHHGRNLEAPEELLRQIVRDESGAAGSDRLAQLLETLISVVEGIEVGDETIGRAAARYNRSTSRARGY